MYDVFKLVVVIGIILWTLRDKIDEPRNVKYCCDKANETEDDLSTDDDSPTDHDEAPAAEPTTDDMPAAEPTIDDDSEEQEEDMLLVEDLYGDYTDLLMPSIMLRLSNNTSINNTFVSRTPRNNCFGVVHASI